MGNHRCQYRHDDFTSQFYPYVFSAFTSDHRHYSSKQCWMEGEHVGNFGTEERPEYFCIFHAPDDKEPPTGFSEEDREASQSRVLKELLIKWNEVNGKLGENERLTFALPEMRCFNADLDGFNFSHNVDFSGATFNGTTLFRNATFSGKALFIDTKFNSNAWFIDTKFNGNAWFIGAIFSGLAMFDDAAFNSDAWLNAVEFNGRAYFSNSWFRKNLEFKANSFNKGCWFTGSKFNDFLYTVHQGEKILFNACSGTFTFTDQDCSKLSFLNMDLSNAGFLGADIKNTRFEACRWEKHKKPWYPIKSSYSIVHQHEQILKDYKNLKNSDDESVKKEAEDEIIKLRSLYLQLKKNLEEGHYFRQAGKFHYREMEIREMLEKGCLDKSMLRLYRWLADFGESWSKLGFWLLLSFVFFAGVVWGWEYLVGDGSLTYGQAFEDVFLAVVPSVFRKGGDYSCLHLVSKIIVIIETVVALLLAALFAMSVRRRFRR